MRFEDFVTQNRLKCWLVDRWSSHRREIARAYREEQDLEHASAGDVEAFQTARLRALLEESAKSPYYGAVLRERRIRPEEFTLADLPRLPFLTKDVLREHGERLRIPDARGAFENHSGGSTGIPVRFWQDARYRVHMSVTTRIANERAGAFPGARVAKLWGAPQDRRQIEGWRGRTKLWLLNMRYFDTFDMGPDRMLEYHRAMEEFQPDLIQAYASSIHLLARFLRARGIRPTYPRVSIITAAEKLFPHMRAEIEEVFPSPVFDRYGSREVSAIAAECPHHAGLHIHAPAYLVETIDPMTGANVAGKPGELAITVLNNHAMPFIRYRIGDMGILDDSPCPCGSSFPRIREIVGRTSDNFLMPDGRIVHGEYFTHIFYGMDGVGQFQFVQDSVDDFTLRIVPGATYSAGLGERIEREVRGMVGPQARFRIELRDDIPKTASGKYRFTVSNVDSRKLLSNGVPQ